MSSNRTLNILRYAASQYPLDLASAFDQCQRAASSKQEDLAYAFLRRIISNTAGHLPSRTDLGDAFQSRSNQKVEKSMRLSRTMINNTVTAVKQAVRAGTLDTLKAGLGLSTPPALSAIQIPTRKEREGLNDMVTTLLARPARIMFQRTSHVPAVTVVLTTRQHPHNSREANIRAAQTTLREVMPELSPDHLFRRLPVKIVTSDCVVK